MENKLVGLPPEEVLVQGRQLVEEMHREVAKVVFGPEMKGFIDFLILAVLADGHVVARANVGIGKTLGCTAIAQTIAGRFTKRQFRPDMLPSEISGFEIYNEEKRRFEIHHGPLYKTNIFLADEINRGTPKAQAALLEAMEERHLTISDRVFPLEEIFLILATRNPIEHEGTYDLPEAQLDRFFGQPDIADPSEETGLLILGDQEYWKAARVRLERVNPVMTPADLMTLRRAIFESVNVEERIDRYVWRLREATWKHPAIAYGSSPRGPINLKKAGTILAYLEGSDYVTPKHVKEKAVEIMAHRIFMKPEHQRTYGGKLRAADIIREILQNVHYD